MIAFNAVEIKIEKSDCHDKAKGKALIAWCTLGYLVCSTTMFAGFEKQQQGTRPASMAYAATALRSNEWGLYYNPALLASLERSGAVYYSPAPFGLTELATGGGVFSEKFSFGTIGLGIQTAGFNLYRETTVSIAFGGTMDRGFYYGVTINYNNLRIERYGSAGAIGLDAGVAVDLTEHLTLGAFASNVNQPKFGRTIEERLPLVYSIGLSYTVASDLLIVADYQKDIRHEQNIRFGLEYLPAETVAVRVGSGTEPSLFTAGLGVTYAGFGFDYAYLHHPDLSGTHMISVVYRFAGS